MGPYIFIEVLCKFKEECPFVMPPTPHCMQAHYGKRKTFVVATIGNYGYDVLVNYGKKLFIKNVFFIFYKLKS
jgi:hypothetical protein